MTNGTLIKIYFPQQQLVYSRHEPELSDAKLSQQNRERTCSDVISSQNENFSSRYILHVCCESGSYHKKIYIYTPRAVGNCSSKTPIISYRTRVYRRWLQRWPTCPDVFRPRNRIVVNTHCETRVTLNNKSISRDKDAAHDYVWTSPGSTELGERVVHITRACWGIRSLMYWVGPCRFGKYHSTPRTVTLNPQNFHSKGKQSNLPSPPLRFAPPPPCDLLAAPCVVSTQYLYPRPRN